MGVTMEMLEVLRLAQPQGPIPEGLKVAASARPDTFIAVPSPVLAIGGFTLWPMSYTDNRVSFGMVMYDLEWRPVTVVERPGARYVCNIELAGKGETGTITFRGQANETVVMKVSELTALMEGMNVLV